MESLNPNVVVEAGVSSRRDAEVAMSWLKPDFVSGLRFDENLESSPAVITVSEGASALADGSATIVQWLSESPRVLWLQLHGPPPQPSSGKLWLMSFECRPDAWQPVLSNLEALNDFQFAVVTLEDSFELEYPVILSALPWDAWDLVAASIRDSSGGIQRRRGPGWETVAN